MKVVVLLLASVCAVALTGCSRQAQEAPPTAREAIEADSSTMGTVTGHIDSPQPGAIVTLTPQAPPATPPPAASAELDQVQMTFVPDTVIAQVGVPVSFRSSDSELHNINVRNSETRSGEFNRSIFPGASFQHTFEEPGFYDVHCDIHPAMSATIFVSQTPFAAVVGQDGTFTIADVPPGGFTMTVYNGAETRERQIQVVAGVNELSSSAD
jgi:plastocyanin